VTLRGSGFAANDAGAAVVRFGASSASGVSVVDDATLRCTAPPGPSRTFATVSLDNANGSSALADAFQWRKRDASDLDDDGIGDLLLGGSEVAWVFFGSASGLADRSASAAGVVLLPSALGGDFGAQLASGDLNGDLLPDVVVAAPLNDAGGQDSGAVFVHFGPLAPSAAPLLSSSAGAVFRGAAAGDRFGTSVVVRDVTGDGAPDLVVGAPRNDAAGTDGGAVYVYRGGAGFSGQTTAQAAVRLLSSGSGDNFGAALAAGDVTGDGLADVIVGAPLDGDEEAGRVLVFRGGPALASTTASSALVRLEGERSDDHVGSSVALADVDGDGIDDLVLGAPDAQNGGMLYILRGGTSLSSRAVDESSTEIGAERSGDRLGQALAVGDANGDGRADVLVGAPQHDVPANNAGRAYLLLGATLQDGAVHVLSQTILVAESSLGDLFGSGLGLGDVSGDGLADLMVGAPFANAGGADSGRLYLFLGSALQATRSAGADDATFTGTVANQALGRALGRAR
jgi:hypothetical protein